MLGMGEVTWLTMYHKHRCQESQGPATITGSQRNILFAAGGWLWDGLTYLSKKPRELKQGLRLPWSRETVPPPTRDFCFLLLFLFVSTTLNFGTESICCGGLCVCFIQKWTNLEFRTLTQFPCSGSTASWLCDLSWLVHHCRASASLSAKWRL